MMRKSTSIAFMITGVCIIILALISCANMQMGAETPAQVYLKARMTFNGLLQDYIVDKRAAPPALRAKWTREIDPRFEQAATALRAWGLAIKNQGSTYEAQSSYLEIKNQLLDILLAELVDYDQ